MQCSLRNSLREIFSHSALGFSSHFLFICTIWIIRAMIIRATEWPSFDIAALNAELPPFKNEEPNSKFHLPSTVPPPF